MKGSKINWKKKATLNILFREKNILKTNRHFPRDKRNISMKVRIGYYKTILKTKKY